VRERAAIASRRGRTSFSIRVAAWLVDIISAWMRPRTKDALWALAGSGSSKRDMTTPTWARLAKTTASG
jgi:hypothetical protein